MRGKRSVTRMASPRRRIIPAHAGQTPLFPVRFAQIADHPRACGANRRALHARVHGRGSSPRMRGKHGASRHRSPPRRIIPAHAGQTCHVYLDLSPLPDHPRACGANSESLGVDDFLCGSSPRMRGKPERRGRRQRRHRIIPAHAGQTGLAAHGTTALSDHPRACGANVSGTCS